MLVFFDLDGVLADFSAGVCQLFQHAPPDQNDLGKELPEIIGCDNGQIWTRIEQKGRLFWENLPATVWANDLIDVVSDIGDIILISTPSFSPSSASGKQAWIQKKFGRRFRDFIITPRKELLAAPNRILIDDLLKNCELFEKAGGKSILFPTYQNGELTAGIDPVEIIKKAIKKWNDL